MSAVASPVGTTPLIAEPVSASFAPPPPPPELVFADVISEEEATRAVAVPGDGLDGLVGACPPAHAAIASNIIKVTRDLTLICIIYCQPLFCADRSVVRLL